MEDLGFGEEEIHDIFRIISAVLKLGNLCFVPTTNMDGTEGCAISNDYGKTAPASFAFLFHTVFRFAQKVSHLRKSVHKQFVRTLRIGHPCSLALTEVHDACHCLRTSYDKLIQVLLVRTIQWPSTASEAASPSTG